MAKIDLSPLGSIDGFQAAALVDVDSGLALATIGGGVNLEVAAAGNTEVYKAKLKVANTLGLNDKALDHQIFVLCHQRFEAGEELR